MELRPLEPIMARLIFPTGHYSEYPASGASFIELLTKDHDNGPRAFFHVAGIGARDGEKEGSGYFIGYVTRFHGDFDPGAMEKSCAAPLRRPEDRDLHDDLVEKYKGVPK